jgi:acyl dehydratase
MVGRFFEEFILGEELITPSRTMTETDIVIFACLSGDYSPHHTDEEFCKNLPFKGKIAHGLLGVSICSGLVVSLDLWRDTALALMELSVQFKAAIKIGDTITVMVKVADKKESKKGDKGVVSFDQIVKNQRDEVVAKMRWVMMIKTKQAV